MNVRIIYTDFSERIITGVEKIREGWDDEYVFDTGHEEDERVSSREVQRLEVCL